MKYIIPSYQPIYTDLSASLVDSTFQTIENDYFIYQGTLDDLFISKAFENFFSEVAKKTGINFDDPYGRVYFPPKKLEDFIEIVLKFRRRIFEGPEWVENSISYYEFEGSYHSAGQRSLEGLTPSSNENFRYKKSELLKMVDVLQNLVIYAIEKNATLEISGP